MKGFGLKLKHIRHRIFGLKLRPYYFNLIWVLFRLVQRLVICEKIISILFLFGASMRRNEQGMVPSDKSWFCENKLTKRDDKVHQWRNLQGLLGGNCPQNTNLSENLSFYRIFYCRTNNEASLGGRCLKKIQIWTNPKIFANQWAINDDITLFFKKSFFVSWLILVGNFIFQTLCFYEDVHKTCLCWGLEHTVGAFLHEYPYDIILLYLT